jgi:methionyl-tRNA formyltransferase
MKKMSETIVFFGSGPVAAKSLDLLARDFNIEAVITKPQPGYHKQAFPVIEVAETLGLKTYTPGNNQELTELFTSSPVKSQVGVVIDYGIIISKYVIDYFPYGIVNSHFSLLPQWRGADPISFAILNGDRITGVSLMLIVEALDEGPLLIQKQLELNGHETTFGLTKKLIDLSHSLLIEALPQYLDGSLKHYPQPDANTSYSRKLSKTDGEIDWLKPANMLEREIRAYKEWPRSYTVIDNIQVIITEAKVVPGSGTPGKMVVHDKKLQVYTTDGLLAINKLIPVGKKEMSSESFLAGYKLKL